MKSKLLGVVIVAMSTLFGACDKMSSSVGPTPVPPINPPSGTYEAVPTERHYLLDVTGAKTHMWARLLAEPKPARGSTITIGPGPANDCAGCFTNFSMEMGLDSLPSPSAGASFRVGFSQDGQTINYGLDGGLVRNGSSELTNPGAIRTFSDKPKYWVVQASFNGSLNGEYGTFPGESGTTSLLADYK